MIADSNRREIEKNLENNNEIEWEIIETVYTVEHLERYSEVKENTPLTEFDLIFILEGTNNIRKGEDAIDLSKRLCDEMDRIVRHSQGWTMPILLQIPPLGAKYKQEIQAERKVYNTFLKSSNYVTISTDEALQDMEEQDTLISDGLHITTEAGKMIARRIKEVVQSYEKVRIERLEQIEQLRQYIAVEMPVEKDSIKHIVGAKGAQIFATEATNRVKISIREQEGKKAKTIVISGQKEGVRNAAEEIQKLVESIRNTALCKFYLQNRCYKGDECRYSHDEDAEVPNKIGTRRASNNTPERERSERGNENKHRYQTKQSANELKPHASLRKGKDQNNIETDRTKYTERKSREHRRQDNDEGTYRWNRHTRRSQGRSRPYENETYRPYETESYRQSHQTDRWGTQRQQTDSWATQIHSSDRNRQYEHGARHSSHHGRRERSRSPLECQERQYRQERYGRKEWWEDERR